MQKFMRVPPRKEDVITAPMKMMRQPTAHFVKKLCKKPRDLDPLMLEAPTRTHGIELEIRRDSKTVVEWIKGKAKHKTTVEATEVAQKQSREWWYRGVDLRRRVGDWAVHIFRGHYIEADAWAGREVRGRTEEWEDDS